MSRTHLSRRDLLASLAAGAAGAFASPGPVLERLAASQPCAEPASAGTLLGTQPLSRMGGIVQPFGTKFGSGLDARLNTDLSLLQPDQLITPSSRAFVRTECPPAAAAWRGPWRIATSGLIARAGTLGVDDLQRRARAMGPHLFECSGNNNPANFGLMSVAEWDGVPLTEVIADLQPDARATAVLVTGMDHTARAARSNSIEGASWIVPLSELNRLGAFLAVRMNGAPLPLDHGHPIRLAVPRWYGCAWIKWVNEIRLVTADEPATSQMKEFAGRTHQTQAHDLARDYAPPEIQAAATAVRVEKRRDASGLLYRVVGIVWGGTTPVIRLDIRFGAEGAWTTFEICPAPKTSATWSLWEYRWRPRTPGTYSVALRIPDTSVPQRRLDTGYYTREVRIEEGTD